MLRFGRLAKALLRGPFLFGDSTHMTARAIRRAQERKLAKLARKEQLSEARLAANQANAQLSTGPTSEDGKAKSSLNAVKTGLTGRTVLLPKDDAVAYERHVQAYQAEFQPVGPRETALFQSLADTDWRLERIPALEMAIYARGRHEFAEKFAHEDPALRPGLIDLETFLTYEKQLRNLHIQEGRLRRQREKDAAELRQLQTERASEPRPSASGQPSPSNGFVFSTPVSLSAHANRAEPRPRGSGFNEPPIPSPAKETAFPEV
jgi:hypothetical protein